MYGHFINYHYPLPVILGNSKCIDFLDTGSIYHNVLMMSTQNPSFPPTIASNHSFSTLWSDILPKTQPCFSHVFLAQFEALLQQLPHERFSLPSTNLRGSYAHHSVVMVPQEKVFKLVQNRISNPNVHGITMVPRLLEQDILGKLRQLPSRTLRRDPLRRYKQQASLVLEEVYLELDDVVAVMRSFSDRLDRVEGIAIAALAKVIRLKADWLSSLGMAGYSDCGGFPADVLAQLSLDNLPDMPLSAYSIATQAIAQLQNHSSLQHHFSANVFQLLTDIMLNVPPPWWLETAHPATDLLSRVNAALDDALIQTFE